MVNSPSRMRCMSLLNALLTAFGLSSESGIVTAPCSTLILRKYLSSSHSTVASSVTIDLPPLSECVLATFQRPHADILPAMQHLGIVHVLEVVRERVADEGPVSLRSIRAVYRAIRKRSHCDVRVVRRDEHPPA